MGGRKKKIYTILKEKGYGRDDIMTCFGEVAFYSLSELNAFLKTKDVPIITLIVAKLFKKAYDDGDWRYIKEIMEQTIGKAVQTTKMDITTQEESNDVDYSKLSVEELRLYMELESKAKVKKD